MQPSDKQCGEFSDPMSFGERSLCYLQTSNPGSTAYNFNFVSSVRPRLEPERGARILAQILQQHSILRANYRPLGGQLQRSYRLASPACELIDATCWTSEECDAWLSARADRSFDLARDALARIAILDRGVEGSLLQLLFHHIVIDLHSLWIMLDEFARCYLSEEDGAAAPASYAYARFAADQARYLQSRAAREKISELARLCNECGPRLTLPFARPRPRRQTFAGASVTLDFESRSVEAMRRLCARNKVSPRSGFLAAYFDLMRRRGGATVITICFPFAGREWSRDGGSVGFFVNTLPISLSVTERHTLRDLLREVDAATARMETFEEIPFGAILDRLPYGGDTDRSSIHQFLFAYHGETAFRGLPVKLSSRGLRFACNGLTFETIELPHRASIMDLSLHVVDTGSEARIIAQYNSDLFDGPDIEKLVAEYRTTIDELAGPQTAATGMAATTGISERPNLDFGLFYFGGRQEPQQPYRTLLEGARFADENGFKAIWTPERHFHAFGGLYPNPSITAAALATATRTLSIRAGSLVLPLHHPVRVAEDWAVIDNLSQGRVEISFAHGWADRDFLLAPNSFECRREILTTSMDTIRRLWRGEMIRLPDQNGNLLPIAIHPQPLQRELPVWLSVAGRPANFQLAGALGAGVLTHLIGQTPEQLGGKIELYRAARAESGLDHGSGRVAVMLHTFLDATPEAARSAAEAALRNYVAQSIDLSASNARDEKGVHPSAALPAADLDLLVQQCITQSLIGTVESCTGLLDRLCAVGVSEIACLIDFGVPHALVMESLKRVARLGQIYRPTAKAAPAPNLLPRNRRESEVWSLWQSLADRQPASVDQRLDSFLPEASQRCEFVRQLRSRGATVALSDDEWCRTTIAKHAAMLREPAVLSARPSGRANARNGSVRPNRRAEPSVGMDRDR